MSNNLFTPPKTVVFGLSDCDGIAFAICGAWRKAARRQGWPNADIEKVTEEAQSADYEHLVRVIDEHSNY